jgi:hypothetical protein
MRNQQKLLLTTGIVFFLFIVSYKFSLFHATSMLDYLKTPDMAPPFTKLLTYILMMIGLPPTILLILYTTFLCHTTLLNWIPQIICFGSPFTLSASDGFFAYIVASLIASGLLFLFLLFLFSPKRK